MTEKQIENIHDNLVDNLKGFNDTNTIISTQNPRQLEEYSCCNEFGDDNFNFINNEVRNRLTQRKVQYYRQLAAPNLPNTQEYAAG